MATLLEICKKHYPKIYKLWTEGNDECKVIAYNIYHHNWGHTLNDEIMEFCQKIGFRIEKDGDFGWYIKY